MRILLSSWLFLIPFYQILLGINIVLVSGQCLEGQRSVLLQLKNSLKFKPSNSTKLVSWNPNTDCCLWGGVTCNNKTGHVVGLDLSSESISGGIDNSSSLFSLDYLESLNLAYNNFNAQIPFGFNNLSSLTHLNLSTCGFVGQIPELPHMTRLLTLDLSTIYVTRIPLLRLENPNLTMLVQNLKELTELHLDGINISAQGIHWCQAISSSLPNLRVLSMTHCYLSGPIDSSLAKLQFLSEIHLDGNNLTAPVPDFFANFTNLTALILSSCNLNGAFPEKIFKVPTLRTLDLSNNGLLQGSLPEFPQSESLETLVLRHTNLSGTLPYSIGNLGMLSRIELANCSFSGPIPNSMANLAQLVYLDLSSNMFTGPMLSFPKSNNLTHIDLSRNHLLGPVHFTHFEGLHNLVHIDLRFNSFNGSIPSSLFAIPSLQMIQLSNNHFDGLLPEFSNASSSGLATIDLSSNNLKGPIPMSLFNLSRLKILSLSDNHLNGTLKLETLHRLSNLTSLDLSYNNLSIKTSDSNSSLFPFRQLTSLKLASCKLQNFPNLRNQSRLQRLDLSDNQIGGEIPNWILEVGNGSLIYLNLSHNLLVNLQEPYVIPSLGVLDLHSNHLNGKIPIPPKTAAYVDYSTNHFNSSIPVDIGHNLTLAYFFSISNNNFTGTIPPSICNISYLQVLDLSNNTLNGSIPSCFMELSKTLRVLNLGKNNLCGNISWTFPSNCGLKTLDLHGNLLEGKVPESLANCRMLEVLNLGSNQINDTFPCFLRNCSNLHVLVLRSNKFYGGIQCEVTNKNWSNLQIVDIASNYFTGDMPSKCFSTWRAMMIAEDDAQSEVNHLRFQVLQFNQFYYQDTVTVTNKGLEMELVKILTVFTSIDMSNNSFQGVIPENIGKLNSLYVLNLSHNNLTGSIPPSIGNLKQLESLDLSKNKLNREIPPTLTSLTFLSFLNLSYNRLTGTIPTGSQFQTFTNTSFEGNEGLCGFPLKKNCTGAETGPTSFPNSKESGLSIVPEFDWQFIFTGFGFGVGAGIVLGPLMFWKQGRHWWNERIDKMVFVILPIFGFIYTCCDDVKLEAEENIGEVSPENTEDSDNNEDELEDETFRRRYCVFCSKLDICRKEVIHNPKCSCYNSTSSS